jgi:hypothetical protein
LRRDADWRVRYEVASRIPLAQIGDLADDSDGLVREMAISRLAGTQELKKEMQV